MTDEDSSFKALFPDVEPLKGSNKVMVRTRRQLSAQNLDASTEKKRNNAETFTQMSDNDLHNTINEVHTVTSELSFRRSGVQMSRFQKLKQAKLPIDVRLDLHGLNLEKARVELYDLIAMMQDQGLRCALLIHGKGYNNPKQEATMKTHVAHWLLQIPAVLAYHSSLQKDGGVGAVYVLVRKSRTGAE